MISAAIKTWIGKRSGLTVAITVNMPTIIAAKTIRNRMCN